MGPGRPALSGSGAGSRRHLATPAGSCSDPLGCGRRGRLGGGRGRHHRSGPPARRRRPKRGSGSYVGTDADHDQALGRSRGGLTTKLHLAGDGRGRPLAMVLTAGQRHESTQLGPLLDAIGVPRAISGRPRKRPTQLTADRGYSDPTCRRLLRQRSIPHTIPERSDQQAARARRGPRGGRPPRSIRCATSSATWSSGPSLGSSSTGPSPPATTLSR
jgi:transposase